MMTDLHSTAQNGANGEKLVYIRRLALEEALKLVPEDALDQLESTDDLFSVHAANGDRLAIVEGRDAAFAAARAYDFRPRSVH